MKHCLIVDDSGVVRKVARSLLEDLEFSISEAEDGRGALALCRDRMPDAILLDGSMPVMDGLEFLTTLRRQGGGEKPKVLYCTTEYDVAHITKAMRAGADEHMMKPFDRELLETKFQDLFSD